MNSKFITARAHFNTMLIEMEHDHGTRDTCVHFLQCLKDALVYTHFESGEDMKRQFAGFYEMFTHMKPRMAIIQNYLDAILEHMADNPTVDPAVLLKDMTDEICDAEKDNERRNQLLKKETAKRIENGSHILVHSHSHTVLDALDIAHRTHKKFNVIVAEQESARTMDIVKYLNARSIPFVVVPEYMLSSVEDDISCMFIGAVTLKQDMHFVVDAGTKALVSELNIAKIPVHLALSTNKFSYWKTKPALQTLKTMKNIAHPHADFSFERIKFSHDRLPLEQISTIITDEGTFTPAQLKVFYKTKLDEYLELHRDLEKKCQWKKEAH